MKKYQLSILVIMLFTMNLYSIDNTEIIRMLDHNILEYVPLAENHFRSGNYQEAVDNFLKVWQRRGDNYNVMFMISQCYGKLGNAELSGRFLLEAVHNGWSDLAQIRKNNAFDDVRENEAFQKYFIEVEEFFAGRNRWRGELDFISVESFLFYRTILPNDFDPDKEYTLLISLHGFGSSPFNYAFVSQDHTVDKDIIHVIPQAPNTMERNMTTMFAYRRDSAFSWSIWGHDPKFHQKYLAESERFSRNYIATLTQKLREQYNINKVFLSGFSQGGYMTISTGLSYPTLFDGLICFGGFLAWSGDIPTDHKIPVLIVHGTTDMVVRYESGREIYDRLKEAGWDVTFHSFEGAHFIPREEFLKALQWMKNQ